MRTWIVLLILYLCLNENLFVINEEDTAVIRSKATWKVEDPSKSIFKKWTKKQVKKLLGAYEDKPNDEINFQSKIMMTLMGVYSPDEYDGRNKYGSCMAPIKNQGMCGSCWAHATVDSFSTTRCLKKNSSTFVQSSIQYMVSCDTQNLGCDGGWGTKAYEFMTSTGVPTATCVPYTSGVGDKGTCPTKCNNSESIDIKHKCANKTSLNLGGLNEYIKFWVSTHGPMYVSFIVYYDFFSYKSGVYYHVSQSIAGRHAVVLVGYGNDPTTKLNYYIAKNSWGTSWGLNGYFYIKQGDCLMGDEARSCLPAN